MTKSRRRQLALPGDCDAGLLKDSQNTTRHKFKDNLEARLLQDVLSPEPGGYFVAFIHGKRYNEQRILTRSIRTTGSEQVNFMTYDENKIGPLGFVQYFGQAQTRQRRKAVPESSTSNWMRRSRRMASLAGKATTDWCRDATDCGSCLSTCFRRLRVQSVTADGQALSFIQEDKNDDARLCCHSAQGSRAGRKVSRSRRPMKGKTRSSTRAAETIIRWRATTGIPMIRAGALASMSLYDMTFAFRRA